MKLLLDEMYPSLLARELRGRGHDVVSVHEAPGSGTTDEDVLEHARSEGRAVVTENVRGYRPLAEALVSAGSRTRQGGQDPSRLTVTVVRVAHDPRGRGCWFIAILTHQAK